MDDTVTYKAGSRKSQLALIQTNCVVDALQKLQPACKLEVISMTTKGDNVLDKPLPKVGKNVFTKELEDKLADLSVDYVVHSMKDVSTGLPEGLVIAAVMEREDPRDAVVTREKWSGCKLCDLPKGSVIGTSSLRRAAQLRRNYSHLIVRDIRGNLNTRLQKLDAKDGPFDAIVLALAGIRRMGWDNRVSEILEPSQMLYAVGQGALAVQCRETDSAMMSFIRPLCHCDTTLRIIAERSFMQALGGGCTAPLAVNSTLSNDLLTLTGGVWRLDGSKVLLHTSQVTLPDGTDEPPRKQATYEMKHFTGIASQEMNVLHLEAAHQLGLDLAKKLRDEGAEEIIKEAKRQLEEPSSFESNGRNGHAGDS